MLNTELKRPTNFHSDSTRSRNPERLRAALEGDAVRAGGSRLTDTVTGTSGFAEQFAAQGPFDRQYRSLHQLDLHRRLLRYPCSYLIYSRRSTPCRTKPKPTSIADYTKY